MKKLIFLLTLNTTLAHATPKMIEVDVNGYDLGVHGRVTSLINNVEYLLNDFFSCQKPTTLNVKKNYNYQNASFWGKQANYHVSIKGHIRCEHESLKNCEQPILSLGDTDSSSLNAFETAIYYMTLNCLDSEASKVYVFSGDKHQKQIGITPFINEAYSYNADNMSGPNLTHSKLVIQNERKIQPEKISGWDKR